MERRCGAACNCPPAAHMFGREDRSGLECGAPTPNTDETTLEGWVTMGRGGSILTGRERSRHYSFPFTAVERFNERKLQLSGGMMSPQCGLMNALVS